MDNITATAKISDLIDTDHDLLRVLARLGIDESLGEKTLAEECNAHGLDVETIALLCTIHVSRGYRPSEEELRHCRPDAVLVYLHNSHDYYLDVAMCSISLALEQLVEPCPESRRQVFRTFFNDYKSELQNHFEFEEGKVIPYIRHLLEGQANQDGFTIDDFEENHSNIDEKLSDLKNLVMKSLPRECDKLQRIHLLQLLFALQDDLRFHTYVEDEILVPIVRLIERPGRHKSGLDEARNGTESDEGELSQREKEILSSIARGLLNKEIADERNISINTVITHRKNITRKTGIKTVAGLTVYAILNNLIDINSIE